MGYFTRIISNATNEDKDADNAKLWDFEIASRHGSGVYIWDIYRYNKRWFKEHIATLTIDYSTAPRFFVSEDTRESDWFKVEFEKSLKPFFKEQYGAYPVVHDLKNS